MVSIKIKGLSKKRVVAVSRKPVATPVDFSRPWAIWLDDERPVPVNSGFQYTAAVNPKEFVDLVKAHGIPSFISFDWYLGAGWDNGEGVIKWLIDYDQQGLSTFPEDFMFDVHSSDHTKNRSMYRMLSEYLDTKTAQALRT
jgi:hypothetical protein